MKTHIFLSFIFIFGQSSFAEETKQDIWMLSGQSNANLHRLEDLQPPVIDKVQWYHANEKNFKTMTNELTGMTRTGNGSPFYTAAYEVAQAGIIVKMFGFSDGGKGINYWVGDKNLKEGPGLTALFSLIKNVNQKVDVFIWYQGESNHKNSLKGYKASLKDLVARLREASKNPEMLAVIVQIGNTSAEDRTGSVNIREAHRQFVAEDDHAILVPAIGRPLVDNVHLGKEGQAALGKEIGKAILKFRHHKEDVNWPGPVLDQAAAGSDAKTVVAHFAEVQKLSGCIPEDFNVTDAQGTVKCTKAVAGETLVTLTMERDIKLPAQVGYAYTVNPKAQLRDEAGNFAPAVLLDIDPAGKIVDQPTSMPNGAGKKPAPEAAPAK